MASGSTVDYNSLLQTATQTQWKRIGTKRRSGVAVPLFSLYSSNSVGIGEFPDIEILIEWCLATGQSIIQLLPMNDTGFDFRPYDAQSSFALDPMYLSLEKLCQADLKAFQADLTILRQDFPTGRARVNYGIKKAKLEILSKIYESQPCESKDFGRFIQEQSYWLEDYALFKTIKEQRNLADWESWEVGLRSKNQDTLFSFQQKNESRTRFWKWVQWQAYEQFRNVKKVAHEKKVLLMGDLPFLVSRDSADVWAHQDHFKLDCVAGAPPDLYFAKGQRWGMPAYEWSTIEAQSYNYLIQKLKYAEGFYDLYRIDHVVGVFRLWTLPISEPTESKEANGAFDPPDESTWEEHGKKILSVMIQNTQMLPCGEDLGTIPECTFRVMSEYGIPGMDVQRWKKDWDHTRTFHPPENYRMDSIAVISTHDMSSGAAWWQHEIATVDEILMCSLLEQKGIAYEEVKDKVFDLSRSRHKRLRWHPDVRDLSSLADLLGISADQLGEIGKAFQNTFDEKAKFCQYLGISASEAEVSLKDLIRESIKQAQAARSVFSIQLLTDWLTLDSTWNSDPWEFRVNFPGTLGEKNWSVVMPYSLEEMLHLSINREIRELNLSAQRE